MIVGHQSSSRYHRKERLIIVVVVVVVVAVSGVSTRKKEPCVCVDRQEKGRWVDTCSSRECYIHMYKGRAG